MFAVVHKIMGFICENMTHIFLFVNSYFLEILPYYNNPVVIDRMRDTEKKKIALPQVSFLICVKVDFPFKKQTSKKFLHIYIYVHISS